MLNSSVIVYIEGEWNLLFQLLVLYALYYNGKMPRRFLLLILAMVIVVIAALPQVRSTFGVHFEYLSILICTGCSSLESEMENRDFGFYWWDPLFTGRFFYYCSGYFSLVSDTDTKGACNTMIFPQLGVPLTYALQFAWEFGSANRNIRLQLARVKTLSETTLRQEPEKQEMLTQQKEKLEVMVADRTRELFESKGNLTKHTGKP